MSTSTSGKHRVARQSGNRGYFGEVEIEVDRDHRNGVIEISFDPAHASEWQVGARFGIEYILERIPRRTLFPRGGRIHVSRIVGHLVDTNNLVIAYVAALAVIDALGIEVGDVPELDAERGSIVFPK